MSAERRYQGAIRPFNRRTHLKAVMSTHYRSVNGQGTHRDRMENQLEKYWSGLAVGKHRHKI